MAYLERFKGESIASFLHFRLGSQHSAEKKKFPVISDTEFEKMLTQQPCNGHQRLSMQLKIPEFSKQGQMERNDNNNKGCNAYFLCSGFAPS